MSELCESELCESELCEYVKNNKKRCDKKVPIDRIDPHQEMKLCNTHIMVVESKKKKQLTKDITALLQIVLKKYNYVTLKANKEEILQKMEDGEL